jgi:hypothetical protein
MVPLRDLAHGLLHRADGVEALLLMSSPLSARSRANDPNGVPEAVSSL